jgi:peptidoglycan/xylan/chitin deacetylase (PgdA/CDA1 family)
MSLTSRRTLLAARTAALLGTVFLPRRGRVVSWLLHELLRIGPAVIRNNDWYGPVAKSFSTDEREVWLTIDDGPDPGSTPEILDVLAAYDAKASFFVIGEKVAWNPALARRITSAGHTLENHTYTHPSAFFWSLPCCLMRAEMQRCSHAIHVATGKAPRWFRSPAGMTNACVHPAAARAWLRVAGWSADGLDGLPGRSPSEVAGRILQNIRPGAIVMLHDGAARDGAGVLRELLPALASEGYRCVMPEPVRVG